MQILAWYLFHEGYHLEEPSLHPFNMYFIPCLQQLVESINLTYKVG